MDRRDRTRVLRGEVFHQGQWMSIRHKYDLEMQRRKKIEAGYVFFQGEWITIDEKCARVTPPSGPAKDDRPAAPIVINQYDNRIVYNIDKRTINRNEHRHVHLDKDTLEEYMRHRLTSPDENPDRFIEEKTPAVDKINRQEKKSLPHRKKISGLLKPPEGNE